MIDQETISELLAACHAIDLRLDRAGRGELACGPAGRDNDWDYLKVNFRRCLAAVSLQLAATPNDTKTLNTHYEQ